MISKRWGISECMIHQMFLLAHHWSTHVTWLNILQLRLVNSWRYSPIFKILYEKYLKDNKQDSLHLAWKYVWRFVLGHYLCLKAHIFPWATLFRTDDQYWWCLQTNKIPSIFLRQMETIVYIFYQTSNLMHKLFDCIELNVLNKLV